MTHRLSESRTILEGIVTTQDPRGETNIAPMGPLVADPSGGVDPLGVNSVFHLRPFQTSTTYRNLKQQPTGVLHVVDDVLLLAQAAIGRPEAVDTFEAVTVSGRVLSTACRWAEFVVTTLDDSSERTSIECRITHVGRLRDHFGFNRARHAVIEAAIVATRLHLIPAEDVRAQFNALRSPVDKTAGLRERTAFAMLVDYVNQQIGGMTP